MRAAGRGYYTKVSGDRLYRFVNTDELRDYLRLRHRHSLGRAVLPATSYSHPAPAPGSLIYAAHFSELRDGTK